MLTLKIKNLGHDVKIEATGDWDEKQSHLEVKRTAHHPAMSCIGEEMPSAARTIAAQIWARASDDLRRSTIHAIEAAMRAALPSVARAGGAGVTVTIGRLGTDLDITVAPESLV